MTLSTLRFGRLTLQHFRKNALLHYSDWPHVQALADNRVIFAAAAHAQRAADYLNQKAAAQVPETCAA